VKYGEPASWLVKIGQMIRNFEEECPICTTLISAVRRFSIQRRSFTATSARFILFLAVFTHKFHFLRSTVIHSASLGQFGNAQMLVPLSFQDVTQQTMSPLQTKFLLSTFRSTKKNKHQHGTCKNIRLYDLRFSCR